MDLGKGCLTVIAIMIVSGIALSLLFVFGVFDSKSKDTKMLNGDQQIEQALQNREFDKAREIAMKFNDDNRLDEKSERQIRLDKINKAQISLMLSDGNLDDAEALSRELGCSELFWEEVNKNIRPLYEADFRSLYMLLSNYPFTTNYHSQLKRFYIGYIRYAQDYAVNKEQSMYSDIADSKTHYYNTNVGYNDEVTKFNNIVLKIVDLAVFDEKTAELKKLVSLLKPEAVETRRKKVDQYSDYYDIDYKLENRAKQQALDKIKEAGIRL